MPPASCPFPPPSSSPALSNPPGPLLTEPMKLTQMFSRRAVGYLWDKRKDLDPGQVKILDSLYNNRRKGALICQQEITYNLAKSDIGQLGYGRLYGSKGSLETLERECRGTICREYYHDIDIKNCHPVILLQYAKRFFNHDLPEVEKLCADRETYMKHAGGNRDEAKQEIIRIIYGGKPKIEFFDSLYNEVSAFTKKISRFEQYEQLFELCKKQKNIYGSFLSHILQTEERKCMMAMKESLEQNDWSVDVLAYDGVMIRKREGLNLHNELRETEKFITEKTGYVMELTDKEMSSFSEYDEMKESNESIEGIPKDFYFDMKREFEMTNFYYSPTNEYIEMTTGEEPLRMDMSHATNYYGRKWVYKVSEKFGDYIQFFPVWRKDLTARTIKRIDMKPSNDPETFVSTPVFKYEKEGDVDDEGMVFFNHLLNIVTKHDAVTKEYVLKWLAHLLQKPFENPGVALVITGGKGIGKDTLIDFLIEYVIGEKYGFNYTSTGQFFDKHDTSRMNKILVKLEEANALLCYKNADELKARITSNTSSFNPKGQKVITTANYTRYVFTVNGACPVDVSDSERRFLIIPASSEKKGDMEFWSVLRERLYTASAGRAVAQYLKGIDLSGFNVRKYPSTSYEKEIMDSKKAIEELFVEEWSGEESSGTELFSAFKNFCIDKGFPTEHNIISFTKCNVVLKMKRDEIIKFRTLNGKTVYYK